MAAGRDNPFFNHPDLADMSLAKTYIRFLFYKKKQGLLMDTSQLFNKGALGYAMARPQYPGKLFDYLGDLSTHVDKAWDCATGNGQAAVSLAQIFARVEATDTSTEQIKNAFKNDRIQYSVQPAEKTRFPDHSFDLVTVAQALHWFNYDTFWPEVHRVLKPGGIFAAWAYTWPHVSKEIDDLVQTKLLDVIEGYWQSNNQMAIRAITQRQMAWNGFIDVPFPFLEIESPGFIMVSHWNLDQFLSYLETWSATRSCMENRGNDFFITLSNSLKKIWGNTGDKRVVEMEFHCRIGRHET